MVEKGRVVFSVTPKEAPCWRRGRLFSLQLRAAALSSPVPSLAPSSCSPSPARLARRTGWVTLQIPGSLGSATACLCMTLAFGWKHLPSSSSWDCPTDIHGAVPGDSGCPGILGSGEGHAQSRTRGEGSGTRREQGGCWGGRVREGDGEGCGAGQSRGQDTQLHSYESPGEAGLTAAGSCWEKRCWSPGSPPKEEGG